MKVLVGEEITAEVLDNALDGWLLVAKVDTHATNDVLGLKRIAGVWRGVQQSGSTVITVATQYVATTAELMDNIKECLALFQVELPPQPRPPGFPITYRQGAVINGTMRNGTSPILNGGVITNTSYNTIGDYASWTPFEA